MELGPSQCVAPMGCVDQTGVRTPLKQQFQTVQLLDLRGKMLGNGTYAMAPPCPQKNNNSCLRFGSAPRSSNQVAASAWNLARKRERRCLHANDRNMRLTRAKA